MSADTEQRIRVLAHHIWESEGCPQGQELRHWHMAERLVQAGEPRPAGMVEPSPSPSPAATGVVDAAGSKPKPGAAAKPAASRTQKKPDEPSPAKGRTR